jgi:tRNA (cmo5U34)-methyltransferase
VRVIDLGCGTGTVPERVLRSLPNAQVTCLDLAEDMITVAQAKLGHHPQVHCVVGDFNTFDLDGKYDVVLSSLALHHRVTNDDKRQFYRRIYGSLPSGEVFYNADVVLSLSDFLQAVYMQQKPSFAVRIFLDKRDSDAQNTAFDG